MAADFVTPSGRVQMPRAPRLHAPGATVHVVARCNNREFCFTTADDFGVLRAHLREMARTYDLTPYAYTLMANHVHVLLQAPKLDALGRPLR
jgi:REP element-mobilizing transposase RayT